MFEDEGNDGRFPDESPVEVRYPAVPPRRRGAGQPRGRGPDDPLHDGGPGLRRSRLRRGGQQLPHLRPGPGTRRRLAERRGEGIPARPRPGRAALGILARFRREGAAAEPVAFGSHRKPEAILLPYELYERCEAMARQRLDYALSAARSVQVELPGPFSPDHDREVSASVDGEISADELYRRTVARYRRP